MRRPSDASRPRWLAAACVALLIIVGSMPTRAAELRVRDLPTFKTVRLGGYHDVNALREALDSSGCGSDRGGATATRIAMLGDTSCRLGASASEIIGRPAFRLSRARTTLDIVVVSVAELGLDAEATLHDIYARAEAFGLALAPAELAPYLRLQYRDQPLGEFLHVAMQPMATYAGELTDLSVANGGAGLLLIGSDARPDLVLPGTTRFVFVRPRRTRPDDQ